MWLAAILERYHDELVCDMAEIYGIYDMTEHPIMRIATLAQGMQANSRVMHKLLQASQEENKEIKSFASPDAFEEARRKILEG